MAVLNTQRGSERRDDGFTLIELSVVLVVVGILITVAMVVLLGARETAGDAAAKARLTQGLKTQKTYYADAAAYTSDVDELERMEASVDFAPYDANVAVLGRVYIKDATGGTLTMVSRSSSGTCFWTRDLNGVTTYATNDCSGEPAASAFSTSW